MLHHFVAGSLGLIVLLGAVQAQTQALPRLDPVDEAISQPEFFAFRARLQAAVARRDAPALLAMVAPDVVVGFGDNNGIVAFRRQWKPEQPGSRLWATLGTLLALGGAFEEPGSFAAPYVHSRWPAARDAYKGLAVVGTQVRLRAAPKVDAPVVATVDFALLERDPEAKPPAGWEAVKDSAGGRAYVAQAFVRAPLDYRAVFSRDSGRWLLSALVAGD